MPPAAAGEKKAATKAKVFLLAGQSNMVGVGKTSELKLPHSEALPTVNFWREKKKAWLPLGPAGVKFGPELSFGRAIRKAIPAGEIYLVKYAAGGTALYNDWSPTSDGPQFKRFVATVTAALENLYSAGVAYEVAGMLWMQGESDAVENKGESYEPNLRAFISDMRRRFKTPEMPFIIARVKDHYGGNSGQAALVRRAQQAVAESTEGVEWFDTDHYSLLNAGHYDGAGLIQMGHDFAKALAPDSGTPD